jgi:hypothetical protein
VKEYVCKPYEDLLNDDGPKRPAWTKEFVRTRAALQRLVEQVIVETAEIQEVLPNPDRKRPKMLMAKRAKKVRLRKVLRKGDAELLQPLADAGCSRVKFDDDDDIGFALEPLVPRLDEPYLTAAQCLQAALNFFFHHCYLAQGFPVPGKPLVGFARCAGCQEGFIVYAMGMSQGAPQMYCRRCGSGSKRKSRSSDGRLRRVAATSERSGVLDTGTKQQGLAKLRRAFFQRRLKEASKQGVT